MDALRKRGKRKKGKMIKRLLVLCVLALLAACASPAAPVPASPPPPPQATMAPAKPAAQCSVTLNQSYGEGMVEVMGKFGMDYYADDPVLLLNGAVASKNNSLNSGDVVSLETPASNCEGPRNVARQVHLVHDGNSAWREISGFQSAITAKRVEVALVQVCQEVRWNLNQYNLKFNGDINTGGCGFITSVKISYASGQVACLSFATVAEAYQAVNALTLSEVKWIAFLSKGEQGNQDYCNR